MPPPLILFVKGIDEAPAKTWPPQLHVLSSTIPRLCWEETDGRVLGDEDRTSRVAGRRGCTQVPR